MKTSLVTRDLDIRKVLLADLQQRFSDSEHDLIVEEFGCKTARADVAVINGSLHAYEIKSDSDSLDRLSSQIDGYKGVFEFVTLVCGRRLLDRARKSIPRWWGLQKAEQQNGQVTITELRTAKPNPKLDPLRLAKMLWKVEALACLRRHGHREVTSRNSAEDVWNAVAQRIATSVLANEVRVAIKARGGSGFARRSAQGGDSYTTESTVRPAHSSAFSWLLSVRSERLPR